MHGTSAQYSRARHSTTSLSCSPHYRPDWLRVQTVVDGFVDKRLLAAGPPRDQEVESAFWSWGEDACDLFVVSVDGQTGREAFFAAVTLVSRATRETRLTGGRKRMRVS